MMNTIEVLLVRPGEPPVRAEIKNDLTAMQELVGGLIQAIYPFEDPGVALVANEEGKLIGLPLNRTLCTEDHLYDIIAGTFFLCGAPPDSEHFTSLTAEQMEQYTERFRYPEYFIRIGDDILPIVVKSSR